MIKINEKSKQGRMQGGFGIETMYPGISLSHGDSGIGTIGRVDHARIPPGFHIPMHPHKDDEILTYMRSGSVLHKDSTGLEEEITPNYMMLMGAGREFQHEELSLEKGGIGEGLQIFIRPDTSDLEPVVQFHDFSGTEVEGQWRLIAGPVGAAPLSFRSQTWIHDLQLTPGDDTSLPALDAKRGKRLLYVFDGQVSADTELLSKGDALLVDAGDGLKIVAKTQAALVLLDTDTSAPVFDGGMFSGNVHGRI